MVRSSVPRVNESGVIDQFRSLFSVIRMKRSSNSSISDSCQEVHQKKTYSEKHLGLQTKDIDPCAHDLDSHNDVLQVKQEKTGNVHIKQEKIACAHVNQENDRVKQANATGEERTMFRIENMPLSTNEGDIRAYFSGMEIPIENGVHIIGGGLAFVEFR